MNHQATTAHVVRARVKEAGVRAMVGRADGVALEAARRHKATAVATAALGGGLTAAALLGSLLKVQQRIAIKVEGNGPLHGPSRHLGCLLFADDPIAADATCCRLMGIEPLRINHLQMTAPIGNFTLDRITHAGEPTASLKQTFVLMPEFLHTSAQ